MSEGRAPGPGHVTVRIHCWVCGGPAASIELVPPGKRPAGWWSWSSKDRRLFREDREPGAWRFLFRGVDASNGMGDDITPEEAAQLAEAFSPPLTYDKVRRAELYDDAGFCAECAEPYCHAHWNVSAGGFGRCPQGHGRSLDPHWSPDDYD